MALLNGNEILFSARAIKVKEPQSKLVAPATEPVTVYPDAGHELESVTVAAVDSSIDMNIQPQNILEGVSILGVEGTDKGHAAGYSEAVADLNTLFVDRTPTYRLPDGITHLKGYLFGFTWYLSKLTIPDSVYYMANNVFRDAYGLNKVVFEGGKITTFGSNLFVNSNKLKTVEFGCEIPRIDSSTFTGCTALETVTLAQDEIGQDVCIHQTSKLKKECAYAIMRKLKNHIGTDREYTYAFKLHATVWSNVDDTTAEGYEAPPAGDSWQNYVTSIGYNT